jgi:hypothetical protein
MKRDGTKPFPVRSKVAQTLLFKYGLFEAPPGRATKAHASRPDSSRPNFAIARCSEDGYFQASERTLPELVGPIAAMMALSKVLLGASAPEGSGKHRPVRMASRFILTQMRATTAAKRLRSG